MSISTSPALRCPRCSAHVAAGGDWCTLCYADLRPPPERPAPVQPGPAVDVEAATIAEAPPSRRGKHAKVTPELGSDAVAPAADVEALANQLLAELAASEGGNPLGSLAGVVDSTGKRIALMASGVVAVIALIVLAMAAVGALL